MNILKKLFNNTTQKKSISGLGSSVVIGESINNHFSFNGLQEDNKLINEGYVSNPDVYPIIKKIAEVGKVIPFIVEQKTPDGWELDEESSLNTLVKTPSSLIKEEDFRFDTMVYLLNTGDIFWKKLTSSFDLVTELELLESNLVDLLYNSDQSIQRYQYAKLDTTLIDYMPEEIIHNKYLDPSIQGIKSQRGLSPLQAAYNTLKSSNNRSLATASMLSNGGASNVISSGTDLIMTEDQRLEIQKNTDKLLGGADKFGKNIVSSANLNVASLGMSSQQMQMIEGGYVDMRTLCNAFSVPSVLFNDWDNATLDNLKIADKKLYTDAVIPNNNKIIRGYDSIIPAYNSFENKELRIAQDLSGIDSLQEDQKTKAEKDKINIEAITSVLTSPISNESKIATLVEVMGYEEEKAIMIVGKEIVDNNETV
tara:strand:- start:1602 stop:2873 length:1272 start_codon:yes stop_codon:yes gene_type:complete